MHDVTFTVTVSPYNRLSLILEEGLKIYHKCRFLTKSIPTDADKGYIRKVISILILNFAATGTQMMPFSFVFNDGSGHSYPHIKDD